MNPSSPSLHAPAPRFLATECALCPVDADSTRLGSIWRLAAAFGCLWALASCAGATPSPAPLPPQRFADSPSARSERADPEKVRAAIPEIEAYLAEQFDKARLPSLAVGLVVGDQLLWTKGFGTRAPGSAADPVDSRTVFRIGSITKVFAGAALLHLRDAGKLDLDAPATRYLPELSGVVYPTRDSPHITVRHLVTHTSGLPRVGKLDYTRPDREVTEAEVLAAIEGARLEFAPGTRQVYSNLGMGLAGLIVGRVSGVRFRDYVRVALLEPLKMSSTTFDEQAIAAGLLATGHLKKGDAFEPTLARWRFGASEAMGGLYSNVEDMARFLSWQLSAWPPRDDPEAGPLRRSTLRESQLPAGLAVGGKALFGINWGVLHDSKLGHVVAHTGSTLEHSAAVRALPRRGIATVVLTGCGDAELITRLSQRVLELAAQASPPPEPELAPPAQQALARIQRLLAEPSEQGVTETFSPPFLQAHPPKKLLEVFGQLKAVGACRSYRVVGAEESGASVVHLECEKAVLEVDFQPREEAPHLLDGFLVRTAR